MGHAGRQRPVGARGLGEGLRVGGIHLGLFAALEGLLGLLLIGELGDLAGVEGRVALDVDREGSEGLLGGLLLCAPAGVRGCYSPDSCPYYAVVLTHSSPLTPTSPSDTSLFATLEDR